MTHRLVMLTRNTTGSYTHALEWRNLIAHVAPANPRTRFTDTTWKSERNLVLASYQAELCVDPIHKDYYLEFPDAEHLLAFQLVWS